ncbi:MAG: PH domain-containing protein [Clostridiales bacterium]|nr:PH domain-containing protein [Clostridiales bacterium]
MKWRRTHPLTMIQFLFRYLYVLLLPVIKSLLELPFHPRPFSGFWLWELAAAALIVLLAAVRWLRIQWRMEPRGLTIRQGLFFQRETHIPFGRISSADVERPLWLACFGAARLMADTPAKSRGDADLTLILKKELAFSLASRLCRKSFPADGRRRDKRPLQYASYRTGILSLIAMSVTSSNAAAGLLLAVPVVNHLGQVLGEELTRHIYDAVDAAANLFARLLPPIAALLTALLLAGWLYSFCRTLMRSARLSACRRGSLVTVRGGLILPRHSVVSVPLTGAVDLQQGLVLRAFSLTSAYLVCSGYGKQKGEHAVLIPAASEQRMQELLCSLLPELTPQQMDSPDLRPVRPPKKALRRYLFWPVVMTAVSAALCLLFYRYCPQLSFLLSTLVMALFVPCVWGFLFCTLGYSRAQVRLDATHCVIGCMSRLKSHLLLVPRSQIRSVTLSRHPFQVDDDLCDVSFLLFGAGRQRFTVKNLSRCEITALFEQNGLPYDASAFGVSQKEEDFHAGSH